MANGGDKHNLEIEVSVSRRVKGLNDVERQVKQVQKEFERAQKIANDAMGNATNGLTKNAKAQAQKAKQIVDDYFKKEDVHGSGSSGFGFIGQGCRDRKTSECNFYYYG